MEVGRAFVIDLSCFCLMCMDGFPDTPVHPRHPVAFSVDHLGSIPVYDVTWFREMARSSGLSGLGL